MTKTTNGTSRINKFADVTCVQVNFNSGTAYSCLVTKKDESWSELRGAAMWRLLNELSLRWRPRKTKERKHSSPTSSQSGSKTDGNQTTWTWSG